MEKYRARILQMVTVRFFTVATLLLTLQVPAWAFTAPTGLESAATDTRIANLPVPEIFRGISELGADALKSVALDAGRKAALTAVLTKVMARTGESQQERIEGVEYALAIVRFVFPDFKFRKQIINGNVYFFGDPYMMTVLKNGQVWKGMQPMAFPKGDTTSQQNWLDPLLNPVRLGGQSEVVPIWKILVP